MKGAKELPIKVLHIIYGLIGGGAETQLVNFINYSDTNIIENAIVCVDTTGKEKLKKNIKIYISKRKRFLDLGIFTSINNAIKDFQPDIVHNWLPEYVTVPGMLLSKIHRKKCIFSFRNTMKLSNYKNIVEYFFALLASDVIISNTQYSLHDKFYKYLFDKKESYIIYNGFAIDEIRKNSSNDIYSVTKSFDSTKFNMIFAGRLTEQKNILTLIEAINLLNNEDFFHLYICGDGEQKPNLIQKVNNYNLNDKVTFLGYVRDVYTIMKNTDLLILPSIYEGMPNVIFEAMSLGIPSLVSNIKQHKQWIVDNENGYLFDVCDANDLARKIKEIYKQKLKKKM